MSQTSDNKRIAENMSQTPITGFDLLKFIMALVIVNIHIQLVDVSEGTLMYAP